MPWEPADRVIMCQWLALHRHCPATLERDEETLKGLATSLGIQFGTISTNHWAVLRKKLVASLHYMLLKMQKQHQLQEYWDVVAKTSRWTWPDDARNKYLSPNLSYNDVPDPNGDIDMRDLVDISDPFAVPARSMERVQPQIPVQSPVHFPAAQVLNPPQPIHQMEWAPTVQPQQRDLDSAEICDSTHRSVEEGNAQAHERSKTQPRHVHLPSFAPFPASQHVIDGQLQKGMRPEYQRSLDRLHQTQQTQALCSKYTGIQSGKNRVIYLLC